MADILHNLVIRAKPETIYRAITEQSGLAAWWTNEVKARPRVNSIAEFNFGEPYHMEMKILELVSGKTVRWKCVEGDKEWIDTKISFRLIKQEEKTLLKFAHQDWEAATDFFAHCNYNWGWYMASLKAYCESGVGKPYQGE